MKIIQEKNDEVQGKKCYKILRKCGKCGCKKNYINTKRFRVNANGNRVDIWLIYQCEKCKHTYNLPIYERIRPSAIEKDEYERFLANDEELAEIYGKDKSIFAKNKAEIK
jgi:hypothetical protein